jgi:nicotinamide phosphoribosyltransferase
MSYNFAADTDSYKYSHQEQTPDNLNYTTSYASARSEERWTHTMCFGPQAQTKKMIEDPLTHEKVDQAEAMALAHCGIFPSEMMRAIVDEYAGLPPVRIQVLPEGLMVPRGVPQYQITSTDPRFETIGQFMETQWVRGLWMPGSVATESWYQKQDMLKMLEKTCDDPQAAIQFALHDFGGRGASCEEHAALAGMAHLVNYSGTDTVPALFAARRFYGENVAGFSIPAMEHFTVTAWGRDREADAYANMIQKFGGEGKKYACVSDAYDIYNAVDNIWGKQLKRMVIEKGGTAVIRPDSGDPTSVVMYVVRSLLNSYGFELNKKGYAVLHPSIRVIQGDGIDRDTIRSIQAALELNQISVENVAFGEGQELLNGVRRDDGGYAQKACAITSGHTGWVGISKDPVTARQKASLKGRQMVYRDDDGELKTAPEGSIDRPNLLEVVYENGTLLRDMKFSEVRQNSNLKF